MTHSLQTETDSGQRPRQPRHRRVLLLMLLLMVVTLPLGEALLPGGGALPRLEKWAARLFQQTEPWVAQAAGWNLWWGEERNAGEAEEPQDLPLTVRLSRFLESAQGARSPDALAPPGGELLQWLLTPPENWQPTEEEALRATRARLVVALQSESRGDLAQAKITAGATLAHLPRFASEVFEAEFDRLAAEAHLVLSRVDLEGEFLPRNEPAASRQDAEASPEDTGAGPPGTLETAAESAPASGPPVTEPGGHPGAALTLLARETLVLPLGPDPQRRWEVLEESARGYLAAEADDASQAAEAMILATDFLGRLLRQGRNLSTARLDLELIDSAYAPAFQPQPLASRETLRRDYLGLLETALDRWGSARQAVEIDRLTPLVLDLAREESHEVTWRTEILMALGVAAEQLRNPELAAMRYAEARELASDDRSALAAAASVARVWKQAGQLPEALLAAREAHALAQDLPRELPPDLARQAADAASERALLEALQGDPEVSESLWAEALERLQTLVEAAPEDMELQAQLATVARNRGQAALASGRTLEAQEALQLATQAQEEIGTEEASPLEKAATQGQLAEAALAVGDRAGAIRALERKAELESVAAERSFRPGRILSLLGQTQRRLALLYLQEGRASEARTQLEARSELQAQRFEDDPGTVSLRRWNLSVIEATELLADALPVASRQGLSAHLQALDALEVPAETAIDLVLARARAAHALAMLTDQQEDYFRRDSARARLTEEALALTRWPEPGEPARLREMALLIESLAARQLMEGNFGGAYRHLVLIRQLLLPQLTPGEPEEAAPAFARSMLELARLQIKQGDAAAARPFLDQASRVLEPFSGYDPVIWILRMNLLTVLAETQTSLGDEATAADTWLLVSRAAGRLETLLSDEMQLRRRGPRLMPQREALWAPLAPPLPDASTERWEALLNAATLLLQQQEFTRVRDLMETRLTIPLGDSESSASQALVLRREVLAGDLARAEGQPAQAELHYREALALLAMEEVGERFDRAFRSEIWRKLGDAAEAQGKASDALAHYRDALALLPPVRTSIAAARQLAFARRVGDLADRQDNLQVAYQAWGHAVKLIPGMARSPLSQRSPMEEAAPESERQFLRQLVEVSLEREDYAAGRDYARQWYQAWERAYALESGRLYLRREITDLRLLQARLALADNSLDEALERISQARAQVAPYFAADPEDPESISREAATWLLEGMTRRARGDPKAARNALRQASELLTPLVSAQASPSVALDLAEAQIEQARTGLPDPGWSRGDYLDNLRRAEVILGRVRTQVEVINRLAAAVGPLPPVADPIEVKPSERRRREALTELLRSTRRQLEKAR